MPKRKRSSRSTRRNAPRRRPRLRGIFRRRRRRKPLALKQHAFCERAEVTHSLGIGMETGTYAAVGHFQDFSLSKMRNAAEYAALFEQYRIDKVVVTFRYKGGNAGIASVAGGANWNESNPLLYFKVDHDDANIQTLTQLKDSMKTRTHMFTNDKPEFSIQLKPACLVEILKSGTTTVNSPKWGVWLNTTDDGVLMNGLKCYAIGYKSGSWDPGSIAISYKYYVSFKNNE